MWKYNCNYLCHHGILNQKWGIRRFQNKDGSLTAAGKKRYSSAKDADTDDIRNKPSDHIKKLEIGDKKIKSLVTASSLKLDDFVEKIMKNNYFDIGQQIAYGKLDDTRENAMRTHMNMHENAMRTHMNVHNQYTNHINTMNHINHINHMNTIHTMHHF